MRNSKEQLEKSDFDSLLKTYPEFASLDFQFAQWLQFNKEYDAAFAQYQLALQKTSRQNSDLQCDIQYQIGKMAILSETKLQYGLQNIQGYVNNCEIKRDMPSKQWATFRYGNLLALSGQKDEAQKLYADLSPTTDQELKGAFENAVKKLNE